MLELLFINNIEKMTDTDIYIWKYISKNVEESKKLTINELGEKCNVSRTTILRFCKKLGLSGYKPFKTYLQTLSSYDTKNPVQKLSKLYQEVISIFSTKDMKNLFEDIYNSNKIYILSNKESSSIRESMKNKFFKYGKFFVNLSHELESNTVINSADSRDFFIFILTSELSESNIELIKRLNNKKVKVFMLSDINIISDDILIDYYYYLSKFYLNNSQGFSTASYEIAIEIIATRYGMFLEEKWLIN